MQTVNYDFQQPWEDFGNAIIVRACDDYVQALKELKKPKPNDSQKEKAWMVKQYNAVREIRNINRFFKGRLYSLITSVDPEYIIQKIIKEYGNEKIVKRINNTPFEAERV